MFNKKQLDRIEGKLDALLHQIDILPEWGAFRMDRVSRVSESTGQRISIAIDKGIMDMVKKAGVVQKRKYVKSGLYSKKQ